MYEKYVHVRQIIIYVNIYTSVGFSTIYGSSSALSLSSVGASTCIGSTTFCCRKKYMSQYTMWLCLLVRIFKSE